MFVLFWWSSTNALDPFKPCSSLPNGCNDGSAWDLIHAFFKIQNSSIITKVPVPLSVATRCSVPSKRAERIMYSSGFSGSLYFCDGVECWTTSVSLESALTSILCFGQRWAGRALHNLPEQHLLLYFFWCLFQIFCLHPTGRPVWCNTPTALLFSKAAANVRCISCFIYAPAPCFWFWAAVRSFFLFPLSNDFSMQTPASYNHCLLAAPSRSSTNCREAILRAKESATSGKMIVSGCNGFTVGTGLQSFRLISKDLISWMNHINVGYTLFHPRHRPNFSLRG